MSSGGTAADDAERDFLIVVAFVAVFGLIAARL